MRLLRMRHKSGGSDKNGLKFSKNDSKIKRLGEGISGSVDLYKLKKIAGFTYVVKTYHCKEGYESNKEYHARVLHEYQVLSQIDNINFIKVYKYSVSFNGLNVKIFMQTGSDNLFNLLRRNTIEPTENLCLWKQICNGVRYLHANHLCHRDLKLENIVVDKNGFVKIIDMATCTSTSDKSIGIVGSDHYISPETITSIYYDGGKSDIWSIGIMLYYQLNHKFPWKSARLSDSTYVAFKQNNHLVDTCNLPDPIMNSENQEIGIESVLRNLPRDSIPLLSHIFQIDPTTRCSIDFFYNDNWFDAVASCTESSRCSFDHSRLVLV